MPRYLEIRTLSRETDGFYVVARYAGDDGPLDFRWEIDPFSYDGLRDAIRFAEREAGRGGRVRLSLAEVIPGRGAIEYVRGRRSVAVSFPCSCRFAGNVEWLRRHHWMEPAPTAGAGITAAKPQRSVDRQGQRILAPVLGLLIGVCGIAGDAAGVDPRVGENAAVAAAFAATAGISAGPEASLEIAMHPGSVEEPGDPNSESPAETGGRLHGCAPFDRSSPEDAAVPETIRENPPGHVSLSFDDGPSEFTRSVVDVLDQHEVAGTFFFVAGNAEKRRDAVRYAAEKGHEIGSHSLADRDLTALSRSEQEREIIEASKRIERLTGRKVRLFRPPYGAWNQETLAILKERKLALALWNRDPQDWNASSSEEIVKRVLEDHPSGGIIILHESRRTLEALPAIIQGLKEAGLNLVPLPASAPGGCLQTT